MSKRQVLPIARRIFLKGIFLRNPIKNHSKSDKKKTLLAEITDTPILHRMASCLKRNSLIIPKIKTRSLYSKCKRIRQLHLRLLHVNHSLCRRQRHSIIRLQSCCGYNIKIHLNIQRDITSRRFWSYLLWTMKLTKILSVCVCVRRLSSSSLFIVLKIV